MCQEAEAEDCLTIDKILADPTSSSWLKAALRSALPRDPVDAANDADVLARVLNERCRHVLEESTST
jgi:hypothetical protein